MIFRQTIPRRIGNIHHRSTRFDDGLHHTRQKSLVGAPGVFGIEFDILDVFFCIFDRRHSTFDDRIGSRFEFGIDMLGRNPDTGMDPFVFGQRQRVGRNVDIALNSAGQRTNCRGGNRLGNFTDGIEITGTGDRETGLDHIDPQRFQRACHFDLLDRI